MSGVNDLTKGNVRKVILVFFFPMFITNMLQQLYTFADTAIVGTGLGDDALAAVGNMGSLNFLIIGFSMGLANGFSVMIAQRFGAKDYENLRKSIASVIILASGMALVLTTISICFLHKALILLRTDPVIIGDSLQYGYIIFGGLGSSIFYNMSAAILRALGDSKTPLKAIIFSSVLNLGLDSFFIFVLKTGVYGAAVATVFSQIISGMICLVALRKISLIHLTKEDYVGVTKLFPVMLLNGIPMALMNSITAIGCMVVQFFVNGYGVAYTSAYSVCGRYINLFMQPACTAGATMSAFSSQNYGAKEYGRIKQGLKVCLMIAFITYILLGGLMVFRGEWLSRLLLKGDVPIALATTYMPIAGTWIFAVDFLFVFRSAVQGMGYPVIPMCSGIAEMVLRIGTIAIFMEKIGYAATAYAEAAAWSGALILNMIAFFFIMAKKVRQQKAEIVNF